MLRPVLREQINERFNRGARSQQFLVESIVGAQTLKAASVEPMMQAQWEERLASYVSKSFDAGVTGALGQNMIQYVSKITTALILFIGAQSVIDGLDDGRRADRLQHDRQPGRPADPRLSQLWQDFQQVQVSVARLGDILNAPPEPVPQNLLTLPPPRGAIDLRNVTMRYRPDAPDVLHNVTLSIAPGEVIGVVGPSGSGKSTLTKLIQRLYGPQTGQVMLDGVDVAQLDPGWLRRQIGVVLQENILFNRSIHENIALADPALARVMVMQAAQTRRRRRVHRPAAAGLRHDDRGAGRESFRRPAPADRHRPRAGYQSAHPDPRRGDLGARLRKRTDHPGQHARDRARANRDHHRPSPCGRPSLHAHRRHEPRRDRRGGVA